MDLGRGTFPVGGQMAELPTGTVTFLFTDIEGSTRLWQERPESMRSAVARHDHLLAEAIDAAGGHVVKGTGDGVYAVFARAHSAVEAAIAAQALFHREEFSDLGHLKVRMAVHTGEAEERQGDYFGPAVNRAARLLGTGHGGQVLVSWTTREILSDASFEFIDLGVHRLRDLARPERVFQLHQAGLRNEFPPLVSLDAHPNNLPIQLTSFVGRDLEVLEVSKLLAGTRLVTLTGVGGAGKTRLSLQVAAELLDTYPDGAWVVLLASVSDPGLVVSQATEPFGVRETETGTGRLLIDVLSGYLEAKELLMVLDNCEHVIDSSASLVETLLARCPQLKILATSRELLGVPGEAVYPVPPLGLPNTEAVELEEADAVNLFADRAVRVQPAFRLSSGNVVAVREITRQLDGLPLAIELAASRTNLLTPDQILGRLDDQFRLLASSRRDRGRHSTLETAMDWSHDLLSPHERSLFRQLAVFAGGWSLEALEAICQRPEADAVDLLGRLVDQSLVDASDIGGTNRYRLLEPVRRYALGKLRAAGEEASARRRHCAFFVEFAVAGESGLRGNEQDAWARRLELDHDNMRTAIDWSLDEGETELALRLVAAMGWFWWMHGHWKEAQRWFHRVYQATPDADPVLRGRTVYKLAALEIQRARPTEVEPLVKEALAVFRDKGTEADIAWATIYLADAAREPERGVQLATEGLDLFAAIGDHWGEAFARMTLGGHLVDRDQARGLGLMHESINAFAALGDRWTAGWFSFQAGHMSAHLGKYHEAREVIERSLALVEGTEDRWVVAHCRSRLAVIATMTGNPDDAKRLFDEALPTHQQIGDETCTALAHLYLGEVFSDEGAFTTAREHLASSLDGYRELQNCYGVANGLRRMGWLAAAMGEHERAARLLGAAEALRDTLGGDMSVHDGHRMRDATESLKAVVPTGRLDEWWDSGVAMGMAEAVEYALGR